MKLRYIPAHSVFTIDKFWGSLGTIIFGNSSSDGDNTRSKLTSRLSLSFFWLLLICYVLLDLSKVSKWAFPRKKGRCT